MEIIGKFSRLGWPPKSVNLDAPAYCFYKSRILAYYGDANDQQGGYLL